MSTWQAVKAKRLLAALERIGWSVSRRSGSHRTLVRSGWAPMTFAFHDRDEVGPSMVAKISKKTGLRPEDL